MLQQENEALQQQLRKQQSLIDSLTHKVEAIEASTAQSGRELQQLAGQFAPA